MGGILTLEQRKARDLFSLKNTAKARVRTV
jgi:hypothetical protein